MKSAKDFRLYGYAGIVLALMMIVAFALDFAIMGTTDGPPGFDLQDIGPDLVRAGDSLIWRIESLLYVLQIVPFAVFALGVYWALESERDGGLPALGLVATGVAWLFSTLHNVAIVTTVFWLIPDYVPGTQEGQLIEVTARGLMAAGNTLFTPGGGVATLLLVIGLAAIGVVTLRMDRLPRWTGYAAIVAAILSLLAYLQYLSEGFFVLALVGWVVYIVWTMAVSLRLTRHQIPGLA